MFKAPKPEDRQKLIEQYKLLNQNNVRVSLGPPWPDSRPSPEPCLTFAS